MYVMQKNQQDVDKKITKSDLLILISHTFKQHIKEVINVNILNNTK